MKSIHLKKISSSISIIVLVLFGIFLLFEEGHIRRKAQSRLDEHARIIADDLWNINAKGTFEYLTLACKSDSYASIWVTDDTGNVFQEIIADRPKNLERLLVSIHLIPQVHLVSDIIHEEKTIGRIDVIWHKKSIYTHIYILFALLLVHAVFQLYVRILQAKQVLKARVRERTADLADANASLQQEINDRLRMEEVLRETEEVFRAIGTAARDAIIMINNEGRITYWSKAGEVILGYSEGEVLGKNLHFQMAPERFHAAYHKAFGYFKATGRGPVVDKTIELAALHKNGTEIPVELSLSSVRLRNQWYAVGIMRDITVRRKIRQEKEDLQEKLARSKKMEALGLLAGGVAHDLNNVLSAIVGYPDLLLMDLPADSPLKKPLLTIKESGQKAAAIVQDLLALARRGVITTDVLNLNPIIADYLKSPEHEKLLTDHPDICVETEFESDLPNIKGSSIHLKKTIMNLVYNAAEAQPGGGKILISTESRYLDRPIRGYSRVDEGDYVVVRVEDHGEGIAESDLPHIFEPFYSKKVMGRSGTGLGMAIVWGAVQDHKGYIDITSVEGKGTVFELYFPLTREKIGKENQRIVIDEYKGRNESILVVDDSEDQREIAAKILSRLNYSVHIVSSGEEAVEFLQDNSVDLIVLDMIMSPGIDGLETFQRILRQHPKQKAIIASGFAETKRVKAAQRAGVGSYIKKPYTIEKIAVAVRTELDKMS